MSNLNVWAGPQPHFESDVAGANFHDKDLMHTHRQCKGCRRFRRCTEDGKSMELLRCRGCEIDSYCSKACQVAAWKSGHKGACQWLSEQKEEVQRITGDARDWGRFTRWLEYHHASLINTALAAYNAIGPKAHENYILFVRVVHAPEHDLLYERSLQAREIYLMHRNSQAGRMFEHVFHTRDGAVALSRQEHGKDYGGTGAYLLLRTYAEGTPEEATIPFWKGFGYDRYHARARPIGDPMALLSDNLNEGKRPRFCCGKFVEAMSGEVCCCGGWTHGNKTDGQSDEVD